MAIESPFLRMDKDGYFPFRYVNIYQRVDPDGFIWFPACHWVDTNMDHPSSHLHGAKQQAVSMDENPMGQVHMPSYSLW